MPGSVLRWITLSVILLNAHSFGANCVERFVNYQSWPKLADANFGPYHRSQQPYILVFVVGPIALALLLQVLLLLHPQPAIPSWIILTLIGTTAAGFVSTIAIQIPIHRQLDDGYSQQLVTKLLKTDWIRKSADLLRLLGTIALLHRFIQEIDRSQRWRSRRISSAVLQTDEKCLSYPRRQGPAQPIAIGKSACVDQCHVDPRFSNDEQANALIEFCQHLPRSLLGCSANRQ